MTQEAWSSSDPDGTFLMENAIEFSCPEECCGDCPPCGQCPDVPASLPCRRVTFTGVTTIPHVGDCQGFGGDIANYSTTALRTQILRVAGIPCIWVGTGTAKFVWRQQGWCGSDHDPCVYCPTSGALGAQVYGSLLYLNYSADDGYNILVTGVAAAGGTLFYAASGPVNCDGAVVANEITELYCGGECAGSAAAQWGFGGSVLIEAVECPDFFCVAILTCQWDCESDPPGWGPVTLHSTYIDHDVSDSGWEAVGPCLAVRTMPYGAALECSDVGPCAPPASLPEPPTFTMDDCCPPFEPCACHVYWRAEVTACDPVTWTTIGVDHTEYIGPIAWPPEPGGGSTGWHQDEQDPCVAYLLTVAIKACSEVTGCGDFEIPTDPSNWPAPPTSDQFPSAIECCGQPCAADCVGCPTNKSGSVAGFSGNCARYNGSWTFTRLNDECIYLSEALPDGTQIGIFCNDGMWIPFPVDQNGWNSTGRQNIDGCPRNGTYGLTGLPGSPPIECPGQTATLALS